MPNIIVKEKCKANMYACNYASSGIL